MSIFWTLVTKSSVPNYSCIKMHDTPCTRTRKKIEDPTHSDYENPENMESNQNLVSKYHDKACECMICYKLVVNRLWDCVV